MVLLVEKVDEFRAGGKGNLGQKNERRLTEDVANADTGSINESIG